MIKTGECYWRDEQWRLWLAESYQDEQGFVTTQDVLVEETTQEGGEVDAGN